MFQILNCEPEGYSRRAREILEQVAEVVEMPLDRAGLIRRLDGFDAIIVRLANQIDAEIMDSAPSIKAISSATTGVDHIDLLAAEQRGITVLTLRGEEEFLDSIVATAEHTWALLLSLVRKLPAALGSVRSGEWNRDRFKGTELRGKRLGIVGLGRLGSKVAAYGIAFGMKVSAYDPYRSERHGWPDNIERSESLKGLLATADVLSIHVPLNEETNGMIGRDHLEYLPAGAVLVNTSRAEIVDEVAMISLLESSHLAGVAVDVIGDERNEAVRRSGRVLSYLSDNWADGRIVVTPHVGGATHESMELTEIFMAKKLVKFLEQSRERSDR